MFGDARVRHDVHARGGHHVQGVVKHRLLRRDNSRAQLRARALQHARGRADGRVVQRLGRVVQVRHGDGRAGVLCEHGVHAAVDERRELLEMRHLQRAGVLELAALYSAPGNVVPSPDESERPNSTMTTQVQFDLTVR